MAPLAEQIRDIQLPPEPAFWPPAPGWWLLGLLLLIALGLLLFQRYRRGALRRAALGELDRLHNRYQGDADLAVFAMGLSTLLRRVALIRDSRKQVAGLSGDAWLAYLDRRGGTTGFSVGEGRVLCALPYGGVAEVDVPVLLDLVCRWLQRNS